MKTFLCDIEGTTTSVSFAHEVLFPISYERMESFLREHWNDTLVQKDLESLKSDLAADQGKDVSSVEPEETVRVLREWILQDRKDARLKSIQGKIWKGCFESGEIRGHMYSDVAPAFRRWRDDGHRVCIFSSGSVEAQQLIFRYSDAGDLTPYIHSYFDTAVGPKKESKAYTAIARELNQSPSEIIFLSDSVPELDAAAEAGMQGIHVIREGTETVSHHPGVHTFADVK